MSKTEFCEWARFNCPVSIHDRCIIRPEAEALKAVKETLISANPRGEEGVAIQNKLQTLAETFCEYENILIRGEQINYEERDLTLMDLSQGKINPALLRLLNQDRSEADKKKVAEMGKKITKKRERLGDDWKNKVVPHFKVFSIEGVIVGEHVLDLAERGDLPLGTTKEILRIINSTPF